MFSIAKNALNKLYFSFIASKFSSISAYLKEFDPHIPLDEAFTPPNTWYTSPIFYEQEIEHIWKKNWVCVDSFLDLKEIGDYKTGNLVDQPYIITKSSENIKVFYNVCIHHGSIIQRNDKGRCDQLECPYHGWTYNLQGALIKCTSMKGIKNFKLKENKLKSIKSYNHGRLFFLNLNENSPTDELKVLLTNFDQTHIRRNVDPLFTDMDFVTAKEFTVNCNWKIFVDNWLDGGYHVPILHKNLNKEIQMKEYIINNYNKLNIQETPGSQQSDRIGEYAIYSFIYPNCMIAKYGPWLDVSIIFPLGVDKCKVSMKWFIDLDKKCDIKFIEESLKSSMEIQVEDIYISELVSRGLKSNGYNKGRYVPSKESGMHNFHIQIHKELSKNT